MSGESSAPMAGSRAVRFEEIDSRDTSTLNSLLVNAYAFAEAFNSFACRRVLSGAEQLQEDAGPARPKQPTTQSLLREFRDQISSDKVWSETPLLSLVRPASIEVQEATSVASITTHILERWSDLPPLPRITELHLSLYAARHEGKVFLSTRRRLPQGSFIGKADVLFAGEIFDPIDVCRNVLARLTGSRRGELSEDYLIQRFIRSRFNLPYRPEIKYLIPSVVDAYNDAFYGKREAVWGRASPRSSSLTTEYLLHVLQSAVSSGLGQGAQPPEHLAVAFYLFFRFCRLLRIRYFRRLSPLSKGPHGFSDDEGATLGGQSLDSLRRLEHGYFLNKVFGTISEISGLNFIFRGGILPRTDSGRTQVLLGPAGSGKTTFALQKLCGVAARGGLAVYFSFEERFELLVDRIVMFRLLTSGEFAVIGPPNPLAELERLAAQKPRKGALVLFGFNQAESFALEAMLGKLGAMEAWKWRAVAIDSINALEIRAGGSGAEQKVARPALQNLVDAIEGNGFLGVIVSEESGQRIEELEYVADTIISFGLGSGDRARWLEIRKCRNQNYHGGKHLFKLVEGEGISITPSLGAIRSALRRRTFGTLGHELVIEAARIANPPAGWNGIRDKSSTLIVAHGNASLGTTMVELALSPLRQVEGIRRASETGIRSVLVVSFRTPESRLLEIIRSSSELEGQWNKVSHKVVRWFSPGSTIVGEQVVWQIWDQVKRARRSGAPIDRILFFDVENVARALPSVGKEDLFWLTLFQMLGVEAVTSFWGFDLGSTRTGRWGDHLDILRSLVDYILQIRGKPGGEMAHQLTVEKRPPSAISQPKEIDAEDEADAEGDERPG